ncbi:hypothetical protein E1B28_012438 [Marasmius oreades]|uniref:CRAL/TRIO N-terminal domain-containing protein n=1 Tax=Marasmius oreades TaxID=181124 RepID=A0A9P7RSI3_9AGAR|nr:uncharacterized protein E1B28_012438 [Marasmius oreades]KAG7088446.1 hypothetical protein E1B28_012438 [Marasmius oreades]
MTEPSQESKLETFRQELFDEDILHDGDSIGTDDETLKYVLQNIDVSRMFIKYFMSRRFLRARNYDLVQAKKMFRDAQHWRKTVEGVGIDELYKQTDPFDVGYILPFADFDFSDSINVCSIRSARRFSSVGLCGASNPIALAYRNLTILGSIRYA